VIASVVFCPHPPLLLPRYAGRVPVAREVYDACISAIRWLGARTNRIVIVGGHPPGASVHDHSEVSRDHARSPLGSVGQTDPRGSVALRVARHLLEDAGRPAPFDEVSVGFGAPTDACLRIGRDLARQLDASARLDGGAGSERVGLLVMADGSARRGERAPGYVDERAFAYDEDFVAAVREGDVAGLAALDPDLGTDLLFQGRAALQVLAGALGVHAALGGGDQRPFSSVTGLSSTGSGLSSSGSGLTSSRQGAAATSAPAALTPSMHVLDWVGDPFGVMYVVGRWSFS
jgi:hypothetical protein